MSGNSLISDFRRIAISSLKSRSSPVGVFPKPENAVFVPIPITLRANDAERSGRASSLTVWSKVFIT
jgi:hypothetical protein